MEHLDEYKLGLFVTGELSEEEEDLLEQHLSVCAECRTRLERAEQLRFQVDPFVRQIKLAANISPVKELIADRLLGNNFLLKEKIGQGGMGVVWEAYDRLGRRRVVLKFLLPNPIRFDEATRTYREAFQKIHMLHHTNICPLYGLYEDPEYGLYLAMKYIDGETLSSYRKREGVLPVSKVVEILRDVAAGLDYSHTHKVVHNDIKPRNIMIGKVDGIQIIDFDLADAIHDSFSSQIKLAEKRVAGTRVYMAPEQWMGTTCLQSDQYALAVTAYELLSGHLPFDGKDINVLSLAVREFSPPTIKGLPDYVNAALQRGLAKDPEKRFATCADFVLALEGKFSEGSGDLSLPRVVEVPLGFPDTRLPEKSEQPKSEKRIVPLVILSVAGVLGFLLLGALFILFVFYPDVTKKFMTEFPLIHRSTPEQTEDRPAPKKPFEEPFHPPITETEPVVSGVEKKTSPQIVLPRRVVKMPTIRILVNIDEKGIVTFNARRANMIEPFPAIEGTRFPFVALQAGTAICGTKPSHNRVVFPQGIVGLPSRSLPGKPRQPFSSFGWKFHSSGQLQSASPFSRYAEGAGIAAPGVMISKRIKLPVTFAYEIVDDSSYYPPHLCITLRCDSNPTARSIRIGGSRHEDGSIFFSGWLDGGHGGMNTGPMRFNNAKLDKTGSVTQRLVIPSDALSRNGLPGDGPDDYYETTFALQVHSGAKGMTKTNGQFDLTYLEIVGDFEASLGVPHRGNVVDLLIVQKIHNALINSIPHSEGTKITGINGTSNPEEIKKILDSLKFGEQVTLDIAQQKRNSKLPVKQTVTLFAQ